MNKAEEFILWFDQISIDDTPLVGGKNSSLGEMYTQLTSRGVNVPNGFAITAKSYFHILEKAGIKEEIRTILDQLNHRNIAELKEKGHRVRELIKKAEIPEDLRNRITSAYQDLCNSYNTQAVDVAVRSSATAEDLPDASFAGQQETYLNIKGPEQLLEACKKCFASLFTNRAISYREDKGFDHFKIGLSIGVQKMVRSDKACSGVMFSIDTESGFKDVVLINGAFGLGENVVQGVVNPDEFLVFKPTLKQGFKPIISKRLGSKEIKMVYDTHGSKHTRNIKVPEEQRKKFVLNEDEVLQLAKWAAVIEDHYSAKAGHHKPMDMEWAKDGFTGELFIVQARPETVHSQKDMTKLRKYVLKEQGKTILTGESVGDRIGHGKVRVIEDVHNIHEFKEGEVLVTDMTDPDWEPIMKIAGAIVTNRGGRTCFAADTQVLTDQGFMTMKEIYNNYEGLSVLSVNRDTLKSEWKPVVAAMKRRSELIEVESSQTGRMKGNSLRLTKDHKMLSFENAELVEKEMQHILRDNQMLSVVQKIPCAAGSSLKEQKLAYLLGAITTDGHVYQSDTHGEVQFIQKPTPEKQQFISHVRQCMNHTFGYDFRESNKKMSQGSIRGKPAVGSANAYRYYSKLIAKELCLEQESIVKTLLFADQEFIMSFLAGVIDGDGSYGSGRINIYSSKEALTQSVVISCLRIGIVPQVTTNRNIHNIQITEKINTILKHTKRVKAESGIKGRGGRFFSAKQLFEKPELDSNLNARINKNLFIDEKGLENSMHLLSPEHRKRIEKVLGSDLRMHRVKQSDSLGQADVYNITVQDNHNYVVFTDRYTPVLVNNCHAAIISRELGIPCIVGTEIGTDVLKDNQEVTVDCSQGAKGNVYQGFVKYELEEHDLGSMPETKTNIMMNIANPSQAFEESFIPNQGVGLAREEFIINSEIKVHPLALLNFDKLEDEKLKAKISRITNGYKNKEDFFINRLAEGVSMIAAAFYPKPVIVRLSDFKSNEYANLIGGHLYEPQEDNPMIGWRGASRYYSEKYRPAFEMECKALLKARNEFGFNNLKIMVPFCRTLDEATKVIRVMRENGLVQGENNLEIYAMCEIPSNVILADKFLEIFDGFSIGSNDLTQLTLGLDRDSELVNEIYDERNDAVKKLIKQVIEVANKKGKYIGICGQGPSDYDDFAEFLVEAGIHSISLNPDTVIKTALKIAEKEKSLGLSSK